MGFTDFLSDSGLTLLNNWLKTHSYITGYVSTSILCSPASPLKDENNLVRVDEAA
jgi:hypothetical protein